MSSGMRSRKLAVAAVAAATALAVSTSHAEAAGRSGPQNLWRWMDEFWRHGIHLVREQVKTTPPSTSPGGVTKPCAVTGTPANPPGPPGSPGQTGQGGCVDPDG